MVYGNEIEDDWAQIISVTYNGGKMKKWKILEVEKLSKYNKYGANPESLCSSYLIWCSSNCMFCNDFILTARRNHMQVQSCEFLNALCIWNNV